MLRRRHLAALSLACLLAAASHNALAKSNKEELEQTRKDIRQTEQRQAELNEQKDKLQEELKDLQERLVHSAESLQRAEADLSDAEEKLRILNDQLKTKSDELKARRKNLSALVQAALSLSHTPPEAMVMMPGDPSQTIKAARALKMASNSVRLETESIGLQMAELQALKDKVAANRDVLARKQSTLDAERKGLVQKLAQRSALQDKLGKQQKAEAEKLAKLAKKADDLQDLVSSIESEQDKRDAEESHPRPSSGNRHGQRSFADAKGRIHPPVSGKVVQVFGNSQGHNDTSKGIVVAARSRAEVTAPYDGEVVFTGPFLNYGQMVIIRHSDDFHTLLAGLAKINTGVGQFLLEGEPIGAMGDSESGNKQENRLYIELRKNNQPIDPAPWIRGLNKK